MIINNILILLYFPIYFISAEYLASHSGDAGLNFMKLIFHLPFLLSGFFIFLNKGSIRKLYSSLPSLIWIYFAINLIIICFLNNDPDGIRSLKGIISNVYPYLTFIMFWSISFCCLDNEREFIYKVRFLLLGLIVTLIMVGLIPGIMSRQFYIGGLYNLRNVPFFRTTINPPVLSAIFLLIIYFCLKNNLKNRFIKNIHINIFYLILIAFTLIFMFMISRRGPILAVFITIIIMSLRKLILKRYYIFIMLSILIMPMILWPNLEGFFNSSLFKEIAPFFRSSDPMNFAELSGRTYMWNNLQYVIDSFKVINIFKGFDVLDMYFAQLGDYGHFHHGIYQLFYETGLLNTLIFISILIVSYYRITYFRDNKYSGVESEITASLFFFILTLSFSESIFSRNEFSYLLLLVIIIIIKNKYFLAIDSQHQENASLYQRDDVYHEGVL